MSKFLKLLLGLAVLVGFNTDLKAPKLEIPSDWFKNMAQELAQHTDVAIKKYTDQAFYAGVDPEIGEIIPNDNKTPGPNVSTKLFKTMPGYRKAIEEKVNKITRSQKDVFSLNALLGSLSNGLIFRFTSKRSGFNRAYVLRYFADESTIPTLLKQIRLADSHLEQLFNLIRKNQYQNDADRLTDYSGYELKFNNLLMAKIVFQDLLFSLWDCAAIQGRQERFLKDSRTKQFRTDANGDKIPDFRQAPRQHFFGISIPELLTPIPSVDATGRPVNKPLMDCGWISTIFFRFNVIGYSLPNDRSGLYLLMNDWQVDQFGQAIQHFINLAMGERPSSPRFPVPTEFFSSTRSSDSFRYQTFPPSTNFGGREGSLPHVTWGSSIRSQSPSRQRLTSTFERESSIFPQQRPSSPRSPRQQGANRLSQDPSSFSRLFGDQFPTLVRTSSQSTSPLRSSLLMPPFPSEESLTSANFPVHSNLESQKKGKEKELNTVVPVIPPVSSPRRSPSPAPVFPSEFFLSKGPISFRGPSSSPSSSPMPFSEILLTAPVILPSQPPSSPKLLPRPASPKIVVPSSSSSSIAPIPAPVASSVPLPPPSSSYSSSSAAMPAGSPKTSSINRPVLTPLILSSDNPDLLANFEAATAGVSSDPIPPSSDGSQFWSQTDQFSRPSVLSSTPPPPAQPGWFRSGLDALTTGISSFNPFARLTSTSGYSQLPSGPSADEIARVGEDLAVLGQKGEQVSAILSRPFDQSRGRSVKKPQDPFRTKLGTVKREANDRANSQPPIPPTGRVLTDAKKFQAKQSLLAKKHKADQAKHKKRMSDLDQLVDRVTGQVAQQKSSQPVASSSAKPRGTTPPSEPSESGLLNYNPPSYAPGSVPNYRPFPSSLTGEPPH